jgi:hypothetical protein
MLKTGAELAKIRGVSRQAINAFITKNAVSPAGRKGKYDTYDTSKEPLASYLSIKQKTKPPTEPLTGATPPPPPNPEAAAHIHKPLNDLLAGNLPPGRKPSGVFFAKAMKIAEANQDAALLMKLAQLADKEDRDEQYQLQMLRTEQAKQQIWEEKSAKMKFENDIRKEAYMAKAEVKLFWGKVCAVHTSILQPLSLKLSSMIAAVPEGSQKELTIKKIIDDEIYAALTSIQKLLADFVAGAETVDKISV